MPNEPAITKEYWTVKELAERGIASVQSIKRWIYEDDPDYRLTSTYSGSRLMVKESDLQEFLARCTARRMKPRQKVGLAV